jgi:putative transcriptional regulator
MAIQIHVSEWLGKRKMTQKDLAELTNIRPATIHAYYYEKVVRIEVDQINRICKALNCQPGDLLTYTPDEEN